MLGGAEAGGFQGQCRNNVEGDREKRPDFKLCTGHVCTRAHMHTYVHRHTHAHTCTIFTSTFKSFVVFFFFKAISKNVGKPSICFSGLLGRQKGT